MVSFISLMRMRVSQMLKGCNKVSYYNYCTLTYKSQAISRRFGATADSDKAKLVWRRCKCKFSSGILSVCLCETCSHISTTPKETKDQHV